MKKNKKLRSVKHIADIHHSCPHIDNVIMKIVDFMDILKENGIRKSEITKAGHEIEDDLEKIRQINDELRSYNINFNVRDYEAYNLSSKMEEILVDMYKYNLKRNSPAGYPLSGSKAPIFRALINRDLVIEQILSYKRNNGKTVEQKYYLLTHMGQKIASTLLKSMKIAADLKDIF